MPSRWLFVTKINHQHRVMHAQRRLQDMTIANSGSVQSYDGDRRACDLIIEGESITNRRVEYDGESAAEELLRSGFPCSLDVQNSTRRGIRPARLNRYWRNPDTAESAGEDTSESWDRCRRVRSDRKLIRGRSRGVARTGSRGRAPRGDVRFETCHLRVRSQHNPFWRQAFCGTFLKS